MLLHPERDHLADKNGRCLRLQHVRAGIIVAFLIVVAASLVAAGTAYACSTTTIQNGNYSVPAHTWLKLTVNRRYDDNNVWKSGWADCQKMIAPNSSP
jgi:hypothetical protein